MSNITHIFNSLKLGECQPDDTLMPIIYNELRKLAHAHMSLEPGGHTLQPTALVHEVWLRMVDEGDRTWDNRSSFFSAASTAMRRILVDHARSKAALKRGGGQLRLDIADIELSGDQIGETILLVDDALEQLERLNPERAQVVVLKFFGGMTSKESAETMGISQSSVDRHWACARAWLFEAIRARIN